jgi:hypothetical protein
MKVFDLNDFLEDDEFDPSQNKRRVKSSSEERHKPTGGSWSSQELRMKENQWYQNESKKIRKKPKIRFKGESSNGI